MSLRSYETSNSGEPSSGNIKRRRRPRAAVACDSCRTRKVKCDGQFPCSSCVQHSFECSFKERQPVAYIDYRRGSNVTKQAQPAGIVPHSETQMVPQPSKAISERIAPLTSPVSLDGAPAPLSPMTSATQGSEPCHSTEREPEGLGDINQHTEGSEFYGHTGTFYFLSRLRSRAKGQRSRRVAPGSGDQGQGREAADDSVVNLLHSSDYSVSGAPDNRATGQSSDTPHPLGGHSCASQSVEGSVQSPLASRSSIGTELERECARLYFLNLHCIHPILDQALFLGRCEREVWMGDAIPAEAPTPRVRARTRFLALFNIVLAIGAITAGETALVMWNGAAKFIDEICRQEEKSISPNTYLPIRASQLFFERAKFHLEDTFESSSFETAQTLFLMSVFCQNALKPHSCYMYAGMALRTALAIGIPTSLHSETSLESRFWWGLYSHEIEMCSSAGRQSFLREPSHYRIPLPRASPSSGPSLYLINCMVELAEILTEISANACRPDEAATLVQRSNRSFTLDERLSTWKLQLRAPLNLEKSSLDEAELITKQKVVLKLRFLNARILLHRPFLISATAESHREQFAIHTQSCVEAASETIQFVHTTYLYRPYFRTWWYNCTYVLDASMVLLYVVLSNINPIAAESIMQDIEKSLEIFSSMKRLAVARRCTEIIKEVLAIARSHLDRSGQPEHNSSSDIYNDAALLSYLANAPPEPQGDGSGADFGLYEGDPFASLVDTNLVFNFLNFEDWTAWSDSGNA
ncbi:hypothetical protein EDB81DRAFT_273189 [Dactylonectria macrodidyma]|uniref:Zn(2)-C6 fungal-type domain-containing protein n=1 Tax=Dactylonectria macrodidyma TaxID=307937 RepID=A0A9P9FN86_9HYPO|nr:hypothetical protein EDB81DRAFT_273189 [Dactylonectria macrodidyma]